ncbi:MAG: putative Ig domain-containing protein [Terriglobia bacterium]|nr:putative Ig domain-containing protein [Terriglobia bacterium]
MNDPRSSIKSNTSHVKVVSPLSITSTALANAVLGAGYSTSLTATGGKHPYTWGAGTALPPGLTLSSSGALSGTPTQAGSYSFVATLRDNSNPSLTTSATVSLNVVSGASTLSATSQTLPGATTGTPYSAALTLSGGQSPYTWSASTSMPAGLTLSSAGVVSGTPTAAGTFGFNAVVKDSSSPAQSSSAAYKLTVTTAAAPLIVATSSLPSGTSGTSYSTTLSASGGMSPYTWSATTALPAGLTLNSNGVLSGTPSTSGTFSLGFKVTDTASPAQTANATLSLNIASAPSAPLSISTTSVPNATSGQGYNVTLMATGGSTPYTWSQTGLPAGLSMSSGGVISGTPTSSGTFSFTAKVTDTSSTTQTSSKALSITVAAAAPTNPLSITTSALPGGTVGSNYSATVQATGGTGAYTWNVTSGALPSGVTLSATTGQLSGTPGTAAQYNFTLQVTDSASPANTSSKSYSVTIANSSASSGTSNGIWMTAGVAPALAGEIRHFIAHSDAYGVKWSASGDGGCGVFAQTPTPPTTTEAYFNTTGCPVGTVTITATSISNTTKYASYPIEIVSSLPYPVGNPLNGSRLYQSSILYSALNSWANASTTNYGWWVIDHVDAGANNQQLAPVVKALAPDFDYGAYMLWETQITEFSTSHPDTFVASMINYCNNTLHTDPENAFYHYYSDTTIKLPNLGVPECSGQNLTIPGWGGGSASQRSQSRAQLCVYDSRRYVMNHSDSSCYQPFVKYRYDALNSTGLYRGVWVDEADTTPTSYYDVLVGKNPCPTSGCTKFQPPIAGTGAIAELGNQTYSQLQGSVSYINGLNSLASSMHNANNSDFMSFGNAAQTLTLGTEKWMKSIKGVYFENGYMNPGHVGDYAGVYWNYIDKMIDDGIFVATSQNREGVPTTNNFTVGNYRSGVERMNMWYLGGYWILSRNGLLAIEPANTFVGDNSGGDFTKRYWDAIGYDIGRPIASRDTVDCGTSDKRCLANTGTDSNGKGYRLWRRDYSKGIVLIAVPANGYDFLYDGTAYVSVGKNCGGSGDGTCHILYQDGTKGPAVDGVNIHNAEALVLVP